jgi:hypothetical protein
MRIKASTTQELTEQLRQHPAIRASLPAPRETPGKATPESAASLRRLIHRAMESDPRIGSLVTNARRITQCRDEGRALLRKHVHGEHVDERGVRRYAKKWAGIEHDYHSMVDLSYQLTSANQTVAAFAQAAKDVDDVHRFANPAFLDRSHRLLLGELGTNLDDLKEAYRYAYIPDRKRMDQAIARISNAIPTQGRKHIGKMVFLYAPERMQEHGVITLAGSDIGWPEPCCYWLMQALASAAALVEKYVRELLGLAAFMAQAPVWFLWLALWFIWNDLNNQLVGAQAHLTQLQQQYDDEVRLLAAEHETATGEETPTSVAREFGYVIGNMSRSKLEVHLPNCSFLHLARPDHLRTLDTLADAQAAGLDNCYYCIGGSMR